MWLSAQKEPKLLANKLELTSLFLQVEYVEGNADVDWYQIRDRAQDLWPTVIKETPLEGSPDSEMQITMVDF